MSLKTDQKITEQVNTPPTSGFSIKQLTQGFSILIASDLLGRVVTMLAFIQLARVLQPAIYGQLELTLAVLVFLIVIVDQGLTPLGSRQITRRPEEMNQLVKTIVSAQVVVSLGILVIFPFLVIMLPLDRTLQLLLIGYTISLLGYPFILNWVFQGKNKMVWVAIPQLARQLTLAVLVLVLLIRPERVLLMPLIELVSILVAVSLYQYGFLKVGGRISIRVRGVFNQNLFRESLPIAGSQIIWAIRLYLPTLLLGFLTTQAVVGFFSAPQRIVMVLQALLVIYFTNLFPHLSRVSAESHHSLAQFLSSSIRLTFWPLLMITVLITILSPLLVGIFFGQAYLKPETVGTMAILIWIIPILVFRGHTRNAFLVINRQKEELICSIAGVIILVILSIPLILSRQSIGAALAIVISEGVATALALWRLKIHLSDFKILNSLWWVKTMSA
jgi:PST family polysaccharide transporter